MSTAPNPLLGWPGQTGINQNQQLPQQPQVPNIGPTSGPQAQQPGGALNPFGKGVRGGGDLGFNLAGQNLITGDWRNQLIGPYAQQMFGLSQPAGNFFNQLTNLGSPYYQQQQRASFEQGNQQGQNAAALARQQLGAQGYGYTPSGAGAAAIGGMAQANAATLSEQFLQNLFNNEQLQLAGAQGLAQLAQLFNPAQLTQQRTDPSIQQPTNTGAEWMNAMSGLLPTGSYKLGG